MDYLKELKNEILNTFGNDIKTYQGVPLIQARPMTYYQFRKFYLKCESLERHTDLDIFGKGAKSMPGFLVGYADKKGKFLKDLTDKELPEGFKYITWYPRKLFKRFYSIT